MAGDFLGSAQPVSHRNSHRNISKGIPIGIAGNFEENTLAKPLAINLPIGIVPY